MIRILGDLIRYNREFALGAVLSLLVLAMSLASFFSPYPSTLQYVVPFDMPPSWSHPFGTNSRGQDVFWELTFAIRNSLLFGMTVALLSRLVALAVGLTSGYIGGLVDRVLMSINDTFVVFPPFPILVLVYFIFKDHMSWALLAVAMASLGWPYDARLIRTVAMSLPTREFTTQSLFSGMSARQILIEEHLPYVLPIVFATTMNNINWSIGLEVTLSVIGFTNIDTPTIGTMIYWANQHTALVAGVWWWIAFPVALVIMTFIGLYLLSVSMNEYIDPRSRLSRMGRGLMRQSRRDEGSASEPLPTAERASALTIDNLRAYYLTHYFGVEREVRAVDDISLVVRRNEIYGLAGESSCGKTTFLKTVAAAVRPPLTVIGGSVRYGFLDRDIYTLSPAELSAIHWKHLSYITQGSMNVLNPVRRVRQSFTDFAYRHMGLNRRAFFAAVERHLERLHLGANVLDAFPHELSGGMKQRVTIALATICRPEFIIADEPTTALDVIVQKDVLAMIREAQQEIGSSMLFVTHDMTVHANIADRLGVMYAGRLVEEAPTAEIFLKPMHPYTAHLVASLPRIGEPSHNESLAGAPPNLADPPSGCRFHPRCPLAMDVCREASPALATLDQDHRVACYAASPLVKPSANAERAYGAPQRAELIGSIR